MLLKLLRKAFSNSYVSYVFGILLVYVKSAPGILLEGWIDHRIGEEVAIDQDGAITLMGEACHIVQQKANISNFVGSLWHCLLIHRHLISFTSDGSPKIQNDANKL